MVPKYDEPGEEIMQRTMEVEAEGSWSCLGTHGLLHIWHGIAGSYDPPQLHAMATHARPNLNYPQTVAFREDRGSTTNLLILFYRDSVESSLCKKISRYLIRGHESETSNIL